jgi:hypothetical protein
MQPARVKSFSPGAGQQLLTARGQEGLVLRRAAQGARRNHGRARGTAQSTAGGVQRAHHDLAMGEAARVGRRRGADTRPGTQPGQRGGRSSSR